jgi:hypothetical protein
MRGACKLLSDPFSRYREKLEIPEEPLCRSAVQGFLKRSDCIKTRKRQLKKSGKDDSNCAWAKARAAQAEQFREQLLIGFLPADSPERIESPFQPSIQIVLRSGTSIIEKLYWVKQMRIST